MSVSSVSRLDASNRMSNQSAEGRRQADYADGDALALEEDMIEIEGEVYKLKQL